jgi:lipoprotein NlpD
MRAAVLVLCGLLSACETVVAPIVDVAQPPATKPGAAKPAAKAPSKPVITAPASGATYTVQKGDTLFAIAFANGLDHRELAAWNELPSAGVIRVGQVLRLTSPMPGRANASGVQVLPVKANEPESRVLAEVPLVTTPQAQRMPWSEANWARLNAESAKVAAKTEPAKAATEPDKPAASDVAKPAADVRPAAAARAESSSAAESWLWPTPGALLGRYGEGGGKGLDLAGERGAPVVAAAPGKVVYSGSGLRGYGQLVIIKHANEYLSAYAHNQKVLVREGEQVHAGQKIAEMGDSDTDRVKLHFEIRQFGKPLDPLKLLPDRS